MPRPVPGRRPDSLFDNRYRYDYIYPRGRSGETLRAYDTQDNDRPVVIKRPALQDAPPMRAGQQVNILNEKRALEALAGHPVLTELRHSGTFRVGGQQHHYIVMDMAGGETVENLTLTLSEQGARLPQLEMLIILDGLLDLLQAAHDKHMVYNDVDAKHLFWDREEYQLKVIDWGNVVFLDENPPAGITKASDILQVGQLLYFVLSGGHRLEFGAVDPGYELPEDVPQRLKSIINRAVQPEIVLRYSDLRALRADLAEVRRPLQRHRDTLIERVRSRLVSANSHSILEELQIMLHEALALDPGFPEARELEREVERRLNRLTMQADLDAIRIYIESGNLERAAALVGDVMRRTGERDSPVLLFLSDVCDELSTQPGIATGLPVMIPEGLMPAMDALINGDSAAAGRALVTTPDPRSAARTAQMLLAERLTVRMPGVVLLRPHLTRLETELAALPDGGGRALQLARMIGVRLDEPPQPGIGSLRQHYERTADTLAMIEEGLEGSAEGQNALAAAVHARRAAEDVIDLMEVISQNVWSDPSRAGNALWQASAIDPQQTAFEALNEMLNTFHAHIDELRGFTPLADGSNIDAYLVQAEARMQSYAADIADPRFQDMVAAAGIARKAWAQVIDSIALGGKRPAADAARQAAEAVETFSESVAKWFDNYARWIEEAARVEQLSPNAAFGKAMADGWEDWDRGRGAEAIRDGRRAGELARTDAEKLAARRLTNLGEALETWLERDGPNSTPQSEATQRRILALYLPDEEALRARFAAQMPKMETYLKAMVKGVVEPLRDASSAAVRILFFDYVLRGLVALQKEQFEDANTWKEAASKTLLNARVHPAFTALENAIVRRLLVLEAVRVLNNTTSVSTLGEARQAVRAPLAAGQLDVAEQAVRSIDEALRRWPDGEFRAARQQLDNAVDRLTAAEATFGKELTPLKVWLEQLSDSAEILAQAKRVVEEEALLPAETPNPAVAEALQKLVDLTEKELGPTYGAQLRDWRDTYIGIRDVYTDARLSKDEKLRILEGHFASLFIDRQPALPIFRRWRDAIMNLPDTQPSASGGAGRGEGQDAAYSFAPEGSGYAELEAESGGRGGGSSARRRRPLWDREGEPEASRAEAGQESARESNADADTPRAARGRRRISPVFLIGGVLALLALIGGIILIGNGGIPGLGGAPGAGADGTGSAPVVAQISPTLRPTNTLQATETPTVPPTDTPTITPTAPPSLTPTATSTPEQAVPTPTEATAIPTGQLIDATALALTAAPANNATLSAGASPEPANPGVVMPTVPPDAQSGDYSVLSALADLEPGRRRWNAEWFSIRDGEWLLGNRAVRTGAAPLIRLGPDVLTPLFGADAARYMRWMEAELELVSYERNLLATGQVFFGVGFETLEGQRTAVQARLVQANVVDLGLNQNGRFLRRTQTGASTVILKARVERNADRTLSLYVDGKLLGQSNAAFPPDAPLSVYLYTSTGGVIVKVNELNIHLDRGN